MAASSSSVSQHEIDKYLTHIEPKEETNEVIMSLESQYIQHEIYKTRYSKYDISTFTNIIKQNARHHVCTRSCQWRSLDPNQKFRIEGKEKKATGNVYVCEETCKVHYCGTIQYCLNYMPTSRFEAVVCNLTNIVLPAQAYDLAKSRDDKHTIMCAGEIVTTFTRADKSAISSSKYEKDLYGSNDSDEEKEEDDKKKTKLPLRTLTTNEKQQQQSENIQEEGEGENTSEVEEPPIKGKRGRKAGSGKSDTKRRRSKKKVDIGFYEFRQPVVRTTVDALADRLLLIAGNYEPHVQRVIAKYFNYPEDFLSQKVRERVDLMTAAGHAWKTHIMTDEQNDILIQRGETARAHWIHQLTCYYRSCSEKRIQPDFGHIVLSWISLVEPKLEGIRYGGSLNKLSNYIRPTVLESLLRMWEKYQTIPGFNNPENHHFTDFKSCCSGMLVFMETGYKIKVYSIPGHSRLYLQLGHLPPDDQAKAEKHKVTFISKHPYLILAKIELVRSSNYKREMSTAKRGGTRGAQRLLNASRGGMISSRGRDQVPLPSSIPAPITPTPAPPILIRNGHTLGALKKSNGHRAAVSKRSNPFSSIIPSLKHLQDLIRLIVTTVTSIDELKTFLSDQIVPNYLIGREDELKGI